MFLKPRHEFGEIAWAETDIELPAQDVLPAVTTGTGRTGKREEICAAGNPADSPALHGGGADLLPAQHAEELAEAVDPFLEHGFERLGRNVATGDAGAARRDDGFHLGIGNPGFEFGDDCRPIVLDDGACGQAMAVALDQFGQRIARFVVGFGSGVGDGKDGDVDRLERPGLVNSARRSAIAGGGKSILGLIDRPAAGGNMVEAGRRLAEALLVDPDIRHDPLDEACASRAWAGFR